MSAGFYKRRRGILDHLETGDISLLDSGIHDYLSLKMNGIVGPGCSIPPGVVFTSSRAIRALCPKGISERAIRRSLEHLEQKGWIKRFPMKPGKSKSRGNYPIVIARASVHDLEGNEYRINAKETIDWRNPKREIVEPSSINSPQTGHELSTDREVESREQREQPAAALPAFTSKPEDLVWSFLGIKPCAPISFRTLLESRWASRNGDQPSVLIGEVVDAWETANRETLPKAARLFAALSKLRYREKETQTQVKAGEPVHILTSEEIPA